MGDKTLLMLFIVFIVIGVFTYDQYVTEKSGESPIAKLLDYGGLSEEGKSGRDLTTVSKYATFEESANSHLQRLAQKLRAIEDQRMKLVRDRNAILAELIELKDKALQEAEKYAEEITKEREEFLSFQPELKEISQLMTDTYKIKNLKIREERIKVIKDKIASLNDGREWGIAQPDIDDLTEFINQSIVQKNLSYLNNCVSTEECLSANVNQAELFLSEVLIDHAQEENPGFVNAVKITQKTRKAYSDQVVYVDLNETFVNDQDEYYKGKYRDLVRKLVRITRNDLNDLIQLYQELEIEEKAVLDNIEVNSKRLSDRYEEDKRQLEELMTKFSEDKLQKYETFFDLIRNNKAVELDYYNKIMDIDKQIVQMLGHRSFENKLFLKNIAALMEINIKRLVDDRLYAQKLNAVYLRFRADLEDRRRKVGIRDIYKDQPNSNQELKAKQQQVKQPEQIKQREAIRQTNVKPPNSNVKTGPNKPDLQRQKQRQKDTMKNFDKVRSQIKDSGM